MEGWYNKLLFVLHIGNPPATGTGTLHITLEDVNDNVPSLYPTLAKVCDDAKDLRVVVLGASDKDLHPNTDPFKFELSKQSGPEKLWRITKLNSKSFTFIFHAFIPSASAHSLAFTAFFSQTGEAIKQLHLCFLPRRDFSFGK